MMVKPEFSITLVNIRTISDRAVLTKGAFLGSSRKRLERMRMIRITRI